ncbi:VOC family protein [Salinibacterium hongtaonis]|uniref:Putative pterin-4-alpha-carbinolamine dehydratase n=1 Tax=Homoserinimonas hongtaonis TaxID=2079791 RepID=A0A2U1SZI9_9MICO|nr:VOC family protein [Salinibacterium hongtaonis]AWB89512.1 pterin-4-alpha-carbinolamine dehydratase [Salinibacterium hongtaonis]PWB96953.1 4a-hydroxytetrahydrobiopterin dehydratase [Salinibacterium hongtaonis]
MSEVSVDPHKLLTPEMTAEDLAGTAFEHLAGALRANYTTPDFVTAAAIVTRAGEIAESLNHHPDMKLGWGRAEFVLTSHDSGGVTSRDVQLARDIHSLAVHVGGEPADHIPSVYEIAIDTTEPGNLRPFWKAVLDYVDVDGGDSSSLVDPRGDGPKVWFQSMDAARTERNRMHVDVYVPAHNAEARLAAALAAGGALITDEFAPDWWVLADIEGNEVCICTSAD